MGSNCRILISIYVSTIYVRSYAPLSPSSYTSVYMAAYDPMIVVQRIQMREQSERVGRGGQLLLDYGG